VSRLCIRIASRFNGPPGSANGGYACGAIASAIGPGVAVRLHRPPPLDADLPVAPAGAGEWKVSDGAALVATVRTTKLALDLPEPVSGAEALESSKHYAGFHGHPFPTCFVCGPDRAAGDGLRIFAGALPSRRAVAAPWQPDRSLAGASGRVRPEFVWAALDCPGYFAVTRGSRAAVLGELAVAIVRPLPVEERCVVMGWPIGSAGRKHEAGTALYGEDGDVVAFGLATWIELREAR
jgi:hypothetical protein